MHVCANYPEKVLPYRTSQYQHSNTLAQPPGYCVLSEILDLLKPQYNVLW